MNKKVGFDWYKVETDRYDDVRIRRLVTNCSTKGLAVYDYLLTSIYRDRGCYIVCNDDCIFSVAEFLNMTESAVKEIISYCGSVGLFHDEFLLRNSNGALLSRGGVITSKAIQRRYVEMCEFARRKSFEMPSDYILISDILSNEGKYRRIDGNFQNVGNLSQNVGNLSQNVGILGQNVGNMQEDSGNMQEDSGIFSQNAGILGQNVGNLSQNAGILPKNAGNSSKKFCVNLALYSIIKYNKYNCSKDNCRVVVVADAPTALQEEVVETTSTKPKISAEEKKRKAIEARKKREQDLYNELIPYVEIYGKEMIREFYDYWTQTNGDDDVTNLMDIAKRKSGKFCLSRRLATWKQKDDERKARIGSSQPRSGNDGGAVAHAAYGGKRESYQQIDDLTSQVIS